MFYFQFLYVSAAFSGGALTGRFNILTREIAFRSEIPEEMFELYDEDFRKRLQEEHATGAGEKKVPRVRYEQFGGIVSNEDPPFLAFVDRAYMRELGYTETPLWSEPEAPIRRLSAPTEVHFACTNRCSAKAGRSSVGTRYARRN